MTPRNVARAIVKTVALVLCLLGAPVTAQAHALLAEAKLERGKVVVTAQYDGGEPAAKAKVFLVDDKAEKTLRGRTGTDGELRFDVPPPGQYEIIVDAGAGHLAKLSIVITEAMQPGPSPPPEPIRLGSGQSIEQAHRSRWWKAAIGVLAIAGFAFVVRIVLGRRRTADGLSTPSRDET